VSFPACNNYPGGMLVTNLAQGVTIMGARTFDVTSQDSWKSK